MSSYYFARFNIDDTNIYVATTHMNPIDSGLVEAAENMKKNIETMDQVMCYNDITVSSITDKNPKDMSMIDNFIAFSALNFCKYILDCMEFYSGDYNIKALMFMMLYPNEFRGFIKEEDMPEDAISLL